MLFILQNYLIKKNRNSSNQVIPNKDFKYHLYQDINMKHYLFNYFHKIFNLNFLFHKNPHFYQFQIKQLLYQTIIFIY